MLRHGSSSVDELYDWKIYYQPDTGVRIENTNYKNLRREQIKTGRELWKKPAGWLNVRLLFVRNIIAQERTACLFVCLLAAGVSIQTIIHRLKVTNNTTLL